MSNYRERDIPAGIAIVHKSRALTNPERHFHPFWELLFIIEGTRTFFYNKRSFQVSSGDLLLVQPGVLHRALNRPGEVCDLITLNFLDNRSPLLVPLLASLEARAASEYPVLSMDEEQRSRFTRVLHSVATEIREKSEGYIAAAWGLLYQSLIDIARSCPAASAVDTDKSVQGQRIAEILDYMSQNFYEPLSLPQVAHRFSLSESYLSHLFKKSTHFTFVEYLNSLRVKEACRLLVSSRMKAGDISQMCGFGSVTQFGRCFREVTGIAPLEYRKQNRLLPKLLMGTSKN